jgi:RimJ/RimL family protein N-acetyltransferase
MPATHLRLLRTNDGPVLEAFLTKHRDSSMFLRSNSLRAGLEYRGEPFQAMYAGAFYDGMLVGVAAHCWNGMLLLQAPIHSADLVRALLAWSGRPVRGLAGPMEQLRAARNTLDARQHRTVLDESEWLFALQLAELCIPAALAQGVVQCRRPKREEESLLREWRAAYDAEALGMTDTAEQRQQSTELLNAQLQDPDTRVTVIGDHPLSFAAHNATLPDTVQLGGIYTPPEYRGKGYAQAAVAAVLLAARERGVIRGVLFTKNPQAVRAYEPLGFRRTGEYGLVLLQ